jgi:hypothetical protein
MKRTEEIVARMKAVKDHDWLGTIAGDLLNYLTFDAAKEHLNEGITAEQWAEYQKEVKPPLVQAAEYLDFAWDKANNCRGISAGRSINHLNAWLWLAGLDDLVNQEFVHYNMYGKRQLVIASVICGVDWRKLDNGRWSNYEEGEGLGTEKLAEAIASAEAVGRKYKPVDTGENEA